MKKMTPSPLGQHPVVFVLFIAGESVIMYVVWLLLTSDKHISLIAALVAFIVGSIVGLIIMPRIYYVHKDR